MVWPSVPRTSRHWTWYPRLDVWSSIPYLNPMEILLLHLLRPWGFSKWSELTLTFQLSNTWVQNFTIYHLFGTSKIWISPLQFSADSDFPHSKVKCIHLGINLFKMYSMDTRKLAIFARDKEKRRTSIFECAPLNTQPAVIQNNVVRKRNPRVPENSVQKKLKIKRFLVLSTSFWEQEDKI